MKETREKGRKLRVISVSVKLSVKENMFPITAGWHRNGLGSICMEIIGYNGRLFSVFSLMNLYLILHYYSCTATTLSCHFRNIEVESNDDSHLESHDALGPGRRILKHVHSLVD